MCWAMYLFTDNDTKEIHYNNENPSMFIEKIKNDSNEYTNILKWNENKKYIYYIGSNQGCGCGWQNTYTYSESFNDEIKYYSNEIIDLNNKIINTNYENMCRELIENKIKYSENEIDEYIKFRKNILENKLREPLKT